MAELGRRLSSRELSEWGAYYRLLDEDRRRIADRGEVMQGAREIQKRPPRRRG